MREPRNRYDVATTTDPSPSSPWLSDENEELQRLENAPPFWTNKTSKRLSKQLSMFELPGDIAWERRRRQFPRQERRKNGINKEAENLTDDDLHELKGCIELGFGFSEENGQRLCTTLPALDLYFAVNRQFATSPLSSPTSSTSTFSLPPSGLRTRSASFGGVSDSWKICNQGDDPRLAEDKVEALGASRCLFFETVLLKGLRLIT